MTVTTSYNDKDNVVTIRVKGRFDFNVVQDFRHAYNDLNKPNASYVVDLGETEYMDSSALGMLLHLWKFAGSEKAKVRLTRCNASIKKVLEITHFGQKFKIE